MPFRSAQTTKITTITPTVTSAAIAGMASGDIANSIESFIQVHYRPRNLVPLDKSDGNHFGFCRRFGMLNNDLRSGAAVSD
jgi:hypothetical protein